MSETTPTLMEGFKVHFRNVFDGFQTYSISFFLPLRYQKRLREKSVGQNFPTAVKRITGTRGLTQIVPYKHMLCS